MLCGLQALQKEMQDLSFVQDKIYPCHHCHNEATRNHEFIRYEVQQVVCSVCDKEQLTAWVWIIYGVCIGKYYCGICKFYNGDDTLKQQFHCHRYGICRTDDCKNIFHCKKCGCCYLIFLLIITSVRTTPWGKTTPFMMSFFLNKWKGKVLNCGHTMHIEFYKKMLKHVELI